MISCNLNSMIAFAATDITIKSRRSKKCFTSCLHTVIKARILYDINREYYMLRGNMKFISSVEQDI